MYSPRLLSQSGAIIIIISLLFMPIASCDGIPFTGANALFKHALSEELKLFLIVTLLCTGAICFFKKPLHRILLALGSALSLVAGYLLANSQYEDSISLRIGSYIAFIGYITIIVINALHLKKENPHQE